MAVLGLCSVSAMADQWSAQLTLSSAAVEDNNGTPLLFVTTSQAVVNPANCASPDGYVMTDSAIVNKALAAALTAIASGAPVAVYVSSSQCASDGRPLMENIQVF